MKEIRGFSVFASLVLIVAFSFLVRGGLAGKSALKGDPGAQTTEHSSFPSTTKNVKTLSKNNHALPFHGKAVRIAAKAWILSHPTTAAIPTLNNKRDNSHLDLRELSLARLLAYAYIAKSTIAPAGKLRKTSAKFADDMDFARFIKTISRFWTSVLSGLALLLVYILTRNKHSAIFAGLALALSPVGLIPGTLAPTPANFAIPFAAAAIVFSVWHVRRPNWRKPLLAAFALTVSVLFWDGALFLLFAWGTAELIRWSTTARRLPSPSRQVLWLALGLAALAATIPVYLYLSEPVFIDSLRLLTLKSRFFNVKPAEPAVLNFSERLLWNFDERSPNNIQIAAFFPVVIPFAVAAILAALPLESLRTQLKRWCVLIHPIHYLTAATCAAFIFFENAYLAAAFFAAVFSGCVLWFWLRNSNRLTARGGVAVLTALLILPSMLTLFFNGAPLAPASLLDAMKTPAAFLAAAAVATCLLLLPLIFLGKVQFGKHFPRCFVIITAIATLAAEFRFSPASNQGGNSDTASLTRWMSSENVENVRFASFPSLSPLIESYCGAGALFQRLPRTPSKIDVYRKFLELMYKGDEMALSEFLAKHEVRYLIFDSATALSKSLYAPRYLADAPVIQPNSPVGMMNSAVGREKLKCLYEVKSNLPDQDISKRFIIFKVVSRKNRSDALKWAYESERLSREGDNALAARLAKSAIFADPNCLPAEIMYRKLFRKPPRIRLRGY